MHKYFILLYNNYEKYLHLFLDNFYSVVDKFVTKKNVLHFLFSILIQQK